MDFGNLFKSKKKKSAKTVSQLDVNPNERKDSKPSKRPNADKDIQPNSNQTNDLTGLNTQPISPRLDTKIYNQLRTSYTSLLNACATSPKAISKVADIMTNGDEFRSFPTYHNKTITKEVLTDTIGLGVIERLLRLHPNITDLGYNGRFLTYKTNDHKYVYGQQPGEDASILSHKYINRIINKFSYNSQNDSSINSTNPILNGMYRHLRVSVDDDSLTPLGIGPTFSLRVSKPKLALNKQNFSENSPMFIYDTLDVLMKSHSNILISGITGSGKTELQKLLVGFIQPDEKIIMIEDTPETHLPVLYPDKDILMWETNAHVNLAEHVANSLRNDADWVMVSETRGGEAYQMFQSVKTGHHITTTLHASSNSIVPSRFVGMCEEAPDINIDPDVLKNDFVDFMNIGIHTNAKKIGGHTYRYIDEIAEFVPYSEDKSGTHPLFRQFLENRNGVAIRHWQTFEPSHNIRDLVRRTLDASFDMPDEHVMEQKKVIKKIPTTKDKVITDEQGKKHTLKVRTYIKVPKTVLVHKDHVEKINQVHNKD